MTICLAIPLSQFGTSLLLYVQLLLLFLTCIHVSQETSKLVWYSHLLNNFPQFVVTHTVKGFTIVNKAEVDGFLKFPCFLQNPMNFGSLISGSSASLKFNLYIWKFSIHVLSKLSLKDFEHNLTSMMIVKQESEKAGLKLSIHKTKIKASSPITSWQIDGETVKDNFLGIKNHCRW